MEIVTLDHLTSWAQSYQAKADFPKLIRRLITCSVKATEIRFPDDHGIWFPGQDGKLITNEGHRFVPIGESLWEIGTEEGPRAKAERDYTNRLSIAQENRQNMTFVFATPHAWPKYSKWVSEKQISKQWKNIIVIDGVDIVAWLQEQNAAQIWFLEQARIIPTVALQTPEKAWLEWSRQTKPEASVEFALAGRKSQVQELAERLAKNECTIIQGESPHEALGFSLAALQSIDNATTKEIINNKIIVLKNDELLSQLDAMHNHIIVLKEATSQSPSIGNGCHLIIPEGNSSISSQHFISLGRPSRQEFVKALKGMGIEDEESEKRAYACGLSVTIFRRQYPAANVIPPRWLIEGNIIVVGAALLAGSWDRSNDNDRIVLMTLAGETTYEAFEDKLLPFLNMDEPPVLRAGGRWRITAPADAFHLLARRLPSVLFGRFKSEAIRILSILNPRVEDPPGQWFFTDTAEQAKRHSHWIRAGLAEAILLLSERGTEAHFHGDAKAFVTDIVSGIKNIGSDWRVVASLKHELARIAEAAPDPFLSSLEHLLEAHSADMSQLFVEPEEIFGQVHYTGLLFALETLAWIPEYLGQVTLILARLTAIDPGGKLLNRPINSLRATYLCWHPCTYAISRQRLQAIDELTRLIPEVAWAVFAGILPGSASSSITNPPKPRWKDLGDFPENDRTRGALYLYLIEVIERACRLAGPSPKRWLVLLGTCSSIDSEQRQRIYSGMLSEISKMPKESTDRLYSELLDFVGRHRSHKEMPWAFSEPELAPIDEIINRCKPHDLIERNLWLFMDWFPEIGVSKGDFDLAQKAYDEIRITAVREVMTDMGVLGIINIACRAKFPGFVADALISVVTGQQIEEIAHLSVVGNVEAQNFSRLLSFHLHRLDATHWLETIETWSQALTTDQTVSLLLGLPAIEINWSFIERLGHKITEHYWKSLRQLPKGDTAHHARFVHNILRVNRPIYALEMVALYKPKIGAPLLLQIIDQVLSHLVAMSDEKRRIPINSADVLELFTLLRNQGAEQGEIAQREYQALPLFGHIDAGEGPLTLHKFMLEDPEFYVSVLVDVYRGDKTHATEGAISETTILRAKHGISLLHSLKSIPGIRSDGSIDGISLALWVKEARDRARVFGRLKVADLDIGRLLAHSPEDTKFNVWPPHEVSDLIQDIQSTDIERGIIIERLNMRGVITRSLDGGGEQERNLASQYRKWINRVMDKNVRAKKLLESIARNFDSHATQEDKESDENKLEY